MFKVSFSGLRERDVVSDLKKSLFCIWFQLVVVILCFATLLVSTGSALTKDEYEFSIKHGSFAVHQRHVNGLRKGEPPGPKVVVEGQNRDSVQRKEQFYPGGESATGAVDGEGEKISSTLAQPTRPSFGAKVSTAKPPIQSIDFEAVTPGLEEVPLQNSVFTSSQGYGQVRAQGPSTSYQSVEHYVEEDDDSDERIAIVRPISAEDFYKTPQLRTPNSERGPVLFPNEPTTTNPTTTTSAKSAGKLLKPIANSSAVQESEEIYLLLKYEAPRKKPSGDRQESDASAGPQVELESSNGDLRLQDGRIRTGGGSFTTVGYFVSGEETSTVAPVPGTSTVSSPEASPEVARGRAKLRNSYGEHLNGDLSDFVNSIRPITENSQDSSGDRGADEPTGAREEIDANLDIAQMTRILAGRQGGLTIPEFNRLFRDYLKKDITVDDLEDFVKYDGEQEGADESQDAPTAEPDATKSFDIRAENGKNVATVAPVKLSDQQPKVQVNKGMAGGKAGRKDKVVKIGYGGSKSYQGVYKSQKFLEKVKAERAPLLSDGAWFRQQLPVREVGPMAYVDNPVFGFAGPRPRMGPMRGAMDLKPIHQAANGVHGGQSYVKFQKIS
ncbi:uncharacterized protein LOC131215861 [Anopheles bellator]|uniref:uncharacterized protein LOC131215861 n=1 Tax=Anopheles bellator TaxID=139047 RepID=UPI002649F386|nr:uncharacterized protein LOC131215861 [Anopheles bellator]